MQILRSAARSTRIAPAESFTGPVYLDALVAAEPPWRLNATRVTFAPGSRTAWHTHGFRQILIATVGNGVVQISGQPAQAFQAGDVVIVPPDTVHWHGATHDSLFTHLALLESEGEATVWLQQVSDGDYAAATQR